MEEALQFQTDVMTEVEKEMMETRITQDELLAAAKALATEKGPGPDGSSAKFFVIIGQH
jgi:hypothetical protein